MNQELAKYFENPNGFITEIETTEDKVQVITATCKDGEPQEYDLTEMQKHLDHFESQYNVVFNNKETIIKRETKTKKGLTKFGVLIAIFSIPIGICFGELFGGIGVITGLLTTAVGIIKTANYKEKLNRDIIIRDSILKNSSNIERAIENDPNVTRYLSEPSIEKLEANRQLQKAGIVRNTVNINFIDQMPQEELEKLYKRTQISRALEEEPTFSVIENKPYTRTRTPQRKKH